MKKATNYLAAALVAVAIFIGSSAKAQTTPATSPNPSPWRLGFGIEGGIPTGNLHTASGFELGGSARLQYDITSSFALTLTSGYNNFFIKTDEREPTSPSSLGIVPAKLGVKYFFVPGIYVAGEAGAGFETNYDKTTKLILSPAIGWANEHWDVGVNYTSYSGKDEGINNNYGSVGLRVAYGFGL